MKMFTLLLTLMMACSQSGDSTQIDTAGTNIASRFPAPKGFTVVKDSFGLWLGQQKLLPDGSPVLLYNGEKKLRQGVHAAVLDISVGKRDLQQCADATMRLRAEYLLAQGKGDEIAFNFTSGDRCSWARWRQGWRPSFAGNKVTWAKTASASSTRDNFMAYMNMVFSYAGTASLAKELKAVPAKEMKPGDIFIQGGHPGHAVMVMAVAKNDKGEIRFLLAQSYMPAQQIHILKNPAGGVWYSLPADGELVTPEWSFHTDQLKRWN